jgi:hypothetical protein
MPRLMAIITGTLINLGVGFEIERNNKRAETMGIQFIDIFSCHFTVVYHPKNLYLLPEIDSKI